MSNKENFTQAMFFLAEVSGKTLTDVMFNFYLKEFEQLDIEKATEVILSFAKDAKWPSINQIKERMGLCVEDLSDDEKARLLTQKVVEAIGDYGWSNEKEAAKWFGDDWKIVIGYSSWSIICDVDNDGLSTFQAQFREYAKAYLRSKKHDTYLALNDKNNTVVSSLLDSKIQNLIDEIPF
jgi:hypothetical protein